MTIDRDAEEMAVPSLLRHARGAYAKAIHASLALDGFDDMPRNGPYVIGGMGNRGTSAAQLIGELGVSKQAASQLIDTLVIRGYLSRSTNPEDRRRMMLELTTRGRAAAAAVLAGVEAIDAELAARIPPDGVTAMRRALEALCDISAGLDDVLAPAPWIAEGKC